MPTNCYADPNPEFQPAMRIISAITNAFPALVTTTFAHQYETGLIVRLRIPLGYGMVAANNLYAPITVTSPATFTIDIDTTPMNPFVVPPVNPGHFYTGAQVIPIASVNSDLYLATRNVLPV